jgi:hypothetical protein
MASPHKHNLHIASLILFRHATVGGPFLLYHPCLFHLYIFIRNLVLHVRNPSARHAASIFVHRLKTSPQLEALDAWNQAFGFRDFFNLKSPDFMI